MQRIDAAIFDFDETMVDLEPQHSTAALALAQHFGDDYEQLPESFRTRSGTRVVDDVREMAEHFGWTTTLDELMAIRQQHFDAAIRAADIVLLPGVERAVRTLREMGLRLAIASSGVRSSIEAVLERVGLRDAFELIVDGSAVQRGKPDPEPYLVTAQKLGVDPERCLVFEDSSVGVLSAKAAGMTCIAVRNPHAQTFQELDAADVVVRSFDDVDFDAIRRAAPTAR